MEQNRAGVQGCHKFKPVMCNVLLLKMEVAVK